MSLLQLYCHNAQIAAYYSVAYCAWEFWKGCLATPYGSISYVHSAAPKSNMSTELYLNSAFRLPPTLDSLLKLFLLGFYCVIYLTKVCKTSWFACTDACLPYWLHVPQYTGCATVFLPSTTIADGLPAIASLLLQSSTTTIGHNLSSDNDEIAHIDSCQKYCPPGPFRLVPGTKLACRRNHL